MYESAGTGTKSRTVYWCTCIGICGTKKCVYVKLHVHSMYVFLVSNSISYFLYFLVPDIYTCGQGFDHRLMHCTLSGFFEASHTS